MRTNFPFNIDLLEQLNTKLDLTLPASQQDLNYYKVQNIPNTYNLGIGLTSRCNLNCPFCYYKEQNRSNNDQLKLDRLKQILFSLKELKLITFSLEGEALLYPYLNEALSLAEKHAQIIQITTNGLLFNQANIELLNSYSKLRSIIISLDSGDPVVYAQLRKGGKLNTLIDRIKNFQRYNRQIELQIYAIITNKNVSTLTTLPKLAADLGIRMISFGLLREHSWSKMHEIYNASDHDILDQINQLIKIAQKEQIQIKLSPYFASEFVISQLKNNPDNPHDLFFKKDQRFCDLPWNFTSILANGNLFPCCGDFAPAPIEEYSFDGIYNHRYLLLFRKLITHSVIPRGCLECHHLK